MKSKKWNKTDLFNFSTQKLRAQTIPAKEKPAPTIDEWVLDADNEQTTTCAACGDTGEFTDEATGKLLCDLCHDAATTDNYTFYGVSRRDF